LFLHGVLYAIADRGSVPLACRVVMAAACLLRSRKHATNRARTAVRERGPEYTDVTVTPSPGPDGVPQ
jgi:hypothetical protein